MQRCQSWSNEPVSKIGKVHSLRGFEPLSLRQNKKSSRLIREFFAKIKRFGI